MTTHALPADVLACPENSYAATAWSKLVLSHFAQYMAARYNGQVFLTGSSLRVAHPRDVDIRVVVADDEFFGRYGHKDLHTYRQNGHSQKWIDDMGKYNGELARQHRLNADFQVMPASDTIAHRHEFRILLASVRNIDHIVRSTQWFDGEDGG